MGNQNYFREYSFDNGRYLSYDPLWLIGDKNQFTYASQSPTHFSDRYGLVTWTGGYVAGSVSFLLGGGVDYYDLTSNCVNNVRARARVTAFYGEGGFGFPVELVAGTVTFEDDQSVPSPDSLQGAYYKVGVTYGVGFGASFAWIVMGRARSLLDLGNLTYNAGISANGVAIGAAVGGSVGYAWSWGKTECCT